jgi:hypothetical protein
MERNEAGIRDLKVQILGEGLEGFPVSAPTEWHSSLEFWLRNFETLRQKFKSLDQA